jgi:hypothetical protein
VSDDLSQIATGEAAADPDVAASESFLDSVVQDAASERGNAVPQSRQETQAAPESAYASQEHVTHWRQRHQAREATNRALREAQENQNRISQELAQLRQQVAAGPRLAPTDPDPEPPFYDPRDTDSTRKWYLWRDRQSARLQQQGIVQALAPIYQHLTGQMQAAQYQQQQQVAVQREHQEAVRVDAMEREYAAAVPHYNQVVQEATGSIARAYQAMGHDAYRAHEMAVRDLHAVFLRGEQAGYHPAQYLHGILTFRGGAQAAAGAAAQAATPPPTSRRVRELQAAGAAPEAGSLAQGSGGPPATRSGAAKLTNNGRSATNANDLRRSGVDPDDIYRVAFQQEFG